MVCMWFVCGNFDVFPIHSGEAKAIIQIDYKNTSKVPSFKVICNVLSSRSYFVSYQNHESGSP